jgi:hypothetical protein
MHLESLKFGRSPKSRTRLEIDEELQHQMDDEGIKIAGLDLSYSEERALFAIQRILDESDYKGDRLDYDASKGKTYHYDGMVPTLEFKTPKYLEAYGVKKEKSARQKMEFSSKGRKGAMKAIERLSQRRLLLFYEKREKVGAKWVKRTVTDISTLFDYQKKQRSIEIVPNPILFDQIDSYYLRKPTKIFNQAGQQNLFELRFLQYLVYQLSVLRRSNNKKKQTWNIKITMEDLAYWLRMESFIVQHKKGQLRKKLNQFYANGKKIGYLKSSRIDVEKINGGKMDILHLSEKYFKKMIDGKV